MTTQRATSSGISAGRRETKLSATISWSVDHTLDIHALSSYNATDLPINVI